MKKTIPLLVSSLLLAACGQKGPLTLENTATPVSTSSASTQTVEKTDGDVSQDESVLNIQTDETSTAR